jgi:hypothetical protein
MKFWTFLTFVGVWWFYRVFWDGWRWSKWVWSRLNVSFSSYIKICIIRVYCAAVLRTEGVFKFSKNLGATLKLSCQNSDYKQVPHWGCKNIGGTVQNTVAWHPGFVHLCTRGSVCVENLWQFLIAVMPLKVIYNNYVTVVYVIGYTKIVDSKPCQDTCKWQSYIQIIYSDPNT